MFVTCVFLEIRVTEARTIQEIRIARARLLGSRLGVQSKSATSDCFSARPIQGCGIIKPGESHKLATYL